MEQEVVAHGGNDWEYEHEEVADEEKQVRDREDLQMGRVRGSTDFSEREVRSTVKNTFG